jgi:16S rRNA (cytosine1402-N4)-methyltransferase
MVNNLPQERLEELIRLYGEERWAKKISRAIVERRRERPVLTTGELSEIVTSAIPRRFHPRKIHPATRTFQAIRIAINREFENLTQALEKAAQCLLPGGALVVISFHSLEDRIVKHQLKKNGLLEVLTKKPVTPQPGEILSNPRARSAKLRAATRITT